MRVGVFWAKVHCGGVGRVPGVARNLARNEAMVELHVNLKCPFAASKFY